MAEAASKRTPAPRLVEREILTRICTTFMMGGGKEIPLKKENLFFIPEAGLSIGYCDQEAYQDGLMEVSSYTHWNCQSRLGAALALKHQTKTVLWKPEIRAYWLHEFNSNPDRLGYVLGGNRYTFGVQGTDENLFEAGAGLSMQPIERLEIIVDLDGQFGRHCSALTLGLRICYEF
jgi:outer membrane autotransporter protein